MLDSKKSKTETAVEVLKEALKSRDPERIKLAQIGVKGIVCYYTVRSNKTVDMHELARELPAMEANMEAIRDLCYDKAASAVEDAIRSVRLALADKVIKEAVSPEKLDPAFSPIIKGVEDILNNQLSIVQGAKDVRWAFYKALHMHAEHSFNGELPMTPEEAAGHVVLAIDVLKRIASLRESQNEKELIEAAAVELKLAFAHWAAPILAAGAAKAVDVGSIQPHSDANERRY